MDTSTDESEQQPLLIEKTLNAIKHNEDNETKTGVYARRWWILGVYCSTCFLQANMWGCWGPIAQSAKAVYNWTDGDIGMLANWGNISYLFAIFPACYFMDTKG